MLQEENRIVTEMHEMMDTINVVPMPGDPDHHFAQLMKMHHEGAINMASVVLEESHNDVIKKLAQQIIHNQKQDIIELENFLEDYINGTANEEFNIAMDMCTDKIGNDLWHRQLNGDIDHDFAMLMIAHHQHAIEMTNLIMRYSRNEAIHRLANEIKEDQEAEIAAFKEWLVLAA